MQLPNRASPITYNSLLERGDESHRARWRMGTSTRTSVALPAAAGIFTIRSIHAHSSVNSSMVTPCRAKRARFLVLHFPALVNHQQGMIFLAGADP